jgi:hypothetical protein
MVGSKPLQETTNTWYHVAASWNNVSFTTYVDGVLDTQTFPYQMGYSQPLNCSFTQCDEGLDIGGYRFITEQGTYYSRQYFSGLIDEVRLWNTGRTEAEIKATMNTVLRGNEPFLVYYYRFDEGMGLLVDSSAFTSYGTLGGGVPDSEPRWVQSDSPLTNPYPSTATPVTCNPPQDSGLVATATILSIVLVIVGMLIGVFVYTRVLNRDYAQVK